MTDLFLQISFIFILIVILTTFFVSLINLLLNQSLKPINLSNNKPFVSVLIPVRNEEKNIPNLLNSLLLQDYQNIEILVLDDNSTDNTYQVIHDYSIKYNNIVTIKGKPLPDGWLGKNWACHQLSNFAKGDLYMFVDSDVFLKSSAISSLLSYFYKYRLDALSVFPTQIMKSFGEKLVVPLMNWILLSLLPLFLIRKSKFNSFIAANGQLFMFSKEIYRRIGGHEAVKSNPVEDMELAKNVKKNGFKIATLLGSELVKCNMYSGFVSSIYGFSKNFYKGFNIPWLIFIFFVFSISLVNILPFLLIFMSIYFLLPVLLIIFNRIILSYLSKQDIFTNIILHIPQFIVFLFIGILSVYKTKLGKNVWKGRPV